MSEHVPDTYRVFWSEEDARWVGTCTEFPSLSHLAPDPGAAVTGIRDLIGDVVEDMHANGEPVPERLSSKTYSGKFIVRVPPELHRRLVIEAAEAQVSLNLSVTATDSGLPGASPKPRQASGSKRKKAGDPGTAADPAPSRGSGGGASAKPAQRKRERKKATAKRPRQAA